MTHEYVNYFEDGREWSEGLKIYVAESKKQEGLFVLYASGSVLHDGGGKDRRFLTSIGSVGVNEFTYGTAESAEKIIRSLFGRPSQFNPPVPVGAVSKEYEELDQSEECLDEI